jgi:hypothetical protein
MVPHPDITSQLCREHQRQMLAAASQRQRRQHARRASKAAGIVAAAIRRLATDVPGPLAAARPAGELLALSKLS